MTNYNFNVGHSNPVDQKMVYELGKEMKFNIMQVGRKSPSNEYHMKLLISPAFMDSGSSTLFLPSDPDELCDTLKLLVQKTNCK